MIHENEDKTLTYKECHDLTEDYEIQMLNGPEIPKRENMLERQNLEDKNRSEDKRTQFKEEWKQRMADGY